MRWQSSQLPRLMMHGAWLVWCCQLLMQLTMAALLRSSLSSTSPSATLVPLYLLLLTLQLLNSAEASTRYCTMCLHHIHAFVRGKHYLVRGQGLS